MAKNWADSRQPLGAAEGWLAGQTAAQTSGEGLRTANSRLREEVERAGLTSACCVPVYLPGCHLPHLSTHVTRDKGSSHHRTTFLLY